MRNAGEKRNKVHKGKMLCHTHTQSKDVRQFQFMHKQGTCFNKKSWCRMQNNTIKCMSVFACQRTLKLTGIPRTPFLSNLTSLWTRLLMSQSPPFFLYEEKALAVHNSICEWVLWFLADFISLFFIILAYHCKLPSSLQLYSMSYNVCKSPHAVYGRCIIHLRFIAGLSSMHGAHICWSLWFRGFQTGPGVSPALFKKKKRSKMRSPEMFFFSCKIFLTSISDTNKGGNL